MAVYKRGYSRYQGPLTTRWTRLLVLPRFAWERMMQQRLIVILFVTAFFWPAACAAFIYLANHTELIAGFIPASASFLKIDGDFFILFMSSQSGFAIILSAFAGPSLIAPDLANGALPLYFSRPFARWEYVTARMFVLLGVLSPVTWIPGMLLFSMQSGMAGWSWFASNWQLGAAIFFGFLSWILFVSLVAMASSAYVKWRIVAGALVLGFFFITAGAAELMAAVLRVEWAQALNPGRAIIYVWRAMLGLENTSGPDTATCLIALLLMAAFLAAVIARKIRPVEVVS
jgi:ABC-2 type transport system permease protein